MNSPARDCYLLTFADETRLCLCPQDRDAGEVVSILAGAAGLEPAVEPGEIQCVVLPVLSPVTRAAETTGRGGDASCVLESRNLPRYRPRVPGAPAPDTLSREEWAWRQFMRLTAAIGSQTHSRGGILLHSALVQLPPRLFPTGSPPGGILLAGCSGVGKTTCCARLPRSWKSLADDLCLVVRHPSGRYFAHPWPTWSRLMFPKGNRVPCRQAVQEAVELRGVFFLRRGKDRVTAIGPGRAVSWLTELSRQASEWFTRDLKPKDLGQFNRACFENACGLLQKIPGFSLYITRRGSFWEKIESVFSPEEMS